MSLFHRVISLSLVWVVLVPTLAQALADEDRPYAGVHPLARISSLLLNPNNSLGFEGGGAVLFAPVPDRDFLVGPRASLLYAPTPNRLDFNLGLEGTLWFANAVGLGFAADLIPVNTHFRYEPFLGLRISHSGAQGALGVRAQIFYDTQYQWGVGVGGTLEWSGVPQIGN